MNRMNGWEWVEVEFDQIRKGEQFGRGERYAAVVEDGSWGTGFRWEELPGRDVQAFYVYRKKPVTFDNLKWPTTLTKDAICQRSTTGTWEYDPEDDSHAYYHSAAALRLIADNLDRMNGDL